MTTVLKAQMQSYVFLALAMSIAGSAVVVGKLMVSDLPVFLAAELGIAASLLFLLPVALVQRKRQARLDRRTHCVLLAQAIFGVVLYRIFIFWGLRYTTATASGLISSAAPALVALMAFLLLREKMIASRVAGVISVSAGILVVNLLPFLNDAAQAADAFNGNFLVLLTLVCESIFSVMSKSQCRPMTAMYRTALVSLYASACLLPLALYDAVSYDFSAISGQSILCIGYYGFFVSFLSYVFWFKGIAQVPAGVAASFTGFVPLSSLLLSWLMLHETITGIHLIGLICILAGVYLSCGFERSSTLQATRSRLAK